MARQNPFKFLDSFKEEDLHLFYGRDQEVDEVYSRLFYSPLLVIYGESGIGKTSLIQCGVANRFSKTDWKPIFIRRGLNLVESLYQKIRKDLQTPCKEDASLTTLLNSMYLDYLTPLYLVFDQFEELFIFGTSEEKSLFVSELSQILKIQSNVHVILSIREEYLANLSEFESKIPNLFENRIRIEKMNRLNLKRAIEGPCIETSLHLEDGVSDLIVEQLQLTSSSFELSYFQVMMDRLYQLACQRDMLNPKITQSLVQHIGRVDDLLVQFLGTQIEELEFPKRGEAFLRTFISGMGTRKQLSLEQILESDWILELELSGDEVRSFLHIFINLRVIRDKDSNDLYELRHDCLANAIYQRMASVDRALIKMKESLLNRFHEYQSRHSVSTLLDHGYLEELKPFYDRLYLSQELEDFIKKSEAHVVRKKQQFYFTLLLIFVCLCSFSAWSLYEKQRAEAQEALAEKRQETIQKQLTELNHALGEAFIGKTRVNQSRTKLDSSDLNQFTSEVIRILYALYALKYISTDHPKYDEFNSRVFSFFNRYKKVFSTPIPNHHTSSIDHLSFSKDGSLLLSISHISQPMMSPERIVETKVWDVKTGEEKIKIAHQKINFNLDSKKQFILRDHIFEEEILSFFRDIRYQKIAISPDVNYLYLIDDQNQFYILDLVTGQKNVYPLPADINKISKMKMYIDQEICYFFNLQLSHMSSIHLKTGQSRTYPKGQRKIVFDQFKNKFLESGFQANSHALDKRLKMSSSQNLPQFKKLHTRIKTSYALSKSYIVLGTFDHQIIIGDFTKSFQVFEFTSNMGMPVSLSISAREDLLAVGTESGTILIWDLQTHRLLGKLNGHFNQIKCITLSDDHQFFATVSRTLQWLKKIYNVQVWKVEDQKSFYSELKIENFYDLDALKMFSKCLFEGYKKLNQKESSSKEGPNVVYNELTEASSGCNLNEIKYIDAFDWWNPESVINIFNFNSNHSLKIDSYDWDIHSTKHKDQYKPDYKPYKKETQCTYDTKSDKYQIFMNQPNHLMVFNHKSKNQKLEPLKVIHNLNMIGILTKEETNELDEDEGSTHIKKHEHSEGSMDSIIENNEGLIKVYSELKFSENLSKQQFWNEYHKQIESGKDKRSALADTLQTQVIESEEERKTVLRELRKQLQDVQDEISEQLNNDSERSWRSPLNKIYLYHFDGLKPKKKLEIKGHGVIDFCLNHDNTLLAVLNNTSSHDSINNPLRQIKIAKDSNLNTKSYFIEIWDIEQAKKIDHVQVHNLKVNFLYEGGGEFTDFSVFDRHHIYFSDHSKSIIIKESKSSTYIKINLAENIGLRKQMSGQMGKKSFFNSGNYIITKDSMRDTVLIKDMLNSNKEIWAHSDLKQDLNKLNVPIKIKMINDHLLTINFDDSSLILKVYNIETGIKTYQQQIGESEDDSMSISSDYLANILIESLQDDRTLIRIPDHQPMILKLNTYEWIDFSKASIMSRSLWGLFKRARWNERMNKSSFNSEYILIENTLYDIDTLEHIFDFSENDYKMAYLHPTKNLIITGSGDVFDLSDLKLSIDERIQKASNLFQTELKNLTIVPRLLTNQNLYKNQILPDFSSTPP